jgi:hypothetical protein
MKSTPSKKVSLKNLGRMFTNFLELESECCERLKADPKTLANLNLPSF